MSSHYHRRSTCRLCDSPNLELVVPIAATPVADAYVPQELLGQTQECFPLDMYQCLACGHVQLVDVVDPAILFTQYSYFSGRSAGVVKHFREYSDNVIRKVGLKEGSLVAEIGSNDGCFLRFFQERGMRVVGIDPAQNIAQAANAAGIETLPEFFNQQVAERIRRDRAPAQVVAANNVFAHTDDLAGMAEAVRSLLADDGVFVFEVSYLIDVIDHLLLGTIFHEHVCYHSVVPLDAFLRRHGLELIDVTRASLQGGSIICTAQLLNGPRKIEPSVADFKALEGRRELHNPATLRGFSARIEEVRSEVIGMLGQLHRDGKTVAGFGAARGGTLLIYHFDLGPILQFIVDDSPDKQHLYSPGYHIPVLPTSEMYQRKPACVFILAWVHSRPIVQNHRRYLDEGGTFITCFPRIKVLTRESPTL
jgi:SAM-dependent methyltransferase